MHVQALCLQDYEKTCGGFLEGVKLEAGNTEIEEGLRYPACLFWLHSSLVKVSCLSHCTKRKAEVLNQNLEEQMIIWMKLSRFLVAMIFPLEQPTDMIFTVQTEMCREALASLKITGGITGKDMLDQRRLVDAVN
jgi:hypothetical protein